MNGTIEVPSDRYHYIIDANGQQNCRASVISRNNVIINCRLPGEEVLLSRICANIEQTNVQKWYTSSKKNDSLLKDWTCKFISEENAYGKQTSYS